MRRSSMGALRGSIVTIWLPHSWQKRARSGTEAPQAGHERARRAPHDEQNRASSSFGALQEGQESATARVYPRVSTTGVVVGRVDLDARVPSASRRVRLASRTTTGTSMP